MEVVVGLDLLTSLNPLGSVGTVPKSELGVKAQFDLLEHHPDCTIASRLTREKGLDEFSS